MNTKFKPLGLAAAVAAATVGYTGVSNAQQYAGNDLGDLALVPYYSVRDNFQTGVHIINTSDQTQVVKVRLRRGTDSMDALDFNLIMSPEDVWAGSIQAEGDNIVFKTDDTSCTAPAATDGKFTMPGIYREGADEGYIEIIAMGSADEDQPISKSALHATSGANKGVPADCAAVRDNFFANGSATKRGVIDGMTSTQRLSSKAATLGTNEYADSGNVLKVSYFLRDTVAGTEFGNSAVHVEDFLANPVVTNQEFGLFSGDLLGFDFPDLNGGTPVGPATDRMKFVDLRSNLGSASVINDWSANADMSVGTDWVITFPGQYTMLNLPQYFASIVDQDKLDTDPNKVTCASGVPLAGGTFTSIKGACDHRDIPAVASFDVYDREEQEVSQPDGELVVSPQLPGEVVRVELPYEVNVVQWGPEAVLGSKNSDIKVAIPEGAKYGWASLTVDSRTNTTLAVCDATPASAGINIRDGASSVINAITQYNCVDAEETRNLIPKIGFVAWERNFPGNEAANYGRIVEHSYGVVESADAGPVEP